MHSCIQYVKYFHFRLKQYLNEMKVKKTIIVFLMFLMPWASVFSQVSDLSLLSNLTESIPGSTMNSEEKSDDQVGDNNIDTLRLDQETNFEDENYGYTGGKNFNNPPQQKISDKPLSYFGYEFFVDAPTTFAPANSIPIPPDYILGPNDNIRIILFGNKNATYRLEVTREGEIFFPGIGPIVVAGSTFLDTKDLIKKVVENQLIGTQVSITLGSLRSIDIFVLGDANQPGMFTVSALSTLTNAIFKSGGIQPTGSLRNIQLKRKGKVISTFDFYNLLLKGDTSDDARLTQGDVIFIPPITKTVGIDGEVGRPGIYELKENETLRDLVQFAGNLKPKADIFSAELKRVDPSENGFSLSQVDLKDSTQDSFQLKNGDVIGIFPVINDLNNAVLISGHARQPGFYPWWEGMRMSDLFRTSADLLSMTDLHYVLIKRLDKLTQSYQFLQADLEEIFKDGSSNANILLNERDEIVLLPSLLSAEQITTKLIQDEYVFDQETNQWVGENEWTSLTYMRKSVVKDTASLELSGQRKDTESAIERSDRSIPDRSPLYYDYSIYDYCSIPEEMVLQIVVSSGHTSQKVEEAKQLVPLEELEKINRPEDVIALQIKIENEKIKSRQLEKKEESEISAMITQECRKQLLVQQIDIINKQIIPTKRKRIISVFGSVHFPGEYPLTEDMVLRDAIKAAGGMKDATYESEIELSRSYDAGKKFSVTGTPVSINDAKAMDVPLQEMDIINFKQISTNIRTVEIKGEVYFAGVYPISENQTLSELIFRAGGITEYGSMEAAFFQREKLRQAVVEQLKSAQQELRRKIVLSSQMSGFGLSAIDSLAVAQLTSLIVDDTTALENEKLGRLVIDLESIMNGTIEDLVLEDGDFLHIPPIQQVVSVVGEVYVPTSHSFSQDLSLDDYISLSGGLNPYADQENIYLIKVDGSMISPPQLSASGFFKRNSLGLEPGDSIVVPLQVQPFSGIRATTEITQIIYQMALAAAAVNSF